MAVELIREPEAISFSKNPMLFEWQSNLAVQSPGRPFIGALDLNVTYGAGDQFFLTFFGITEQFTFSDTPDDSGYQLPSYESADFNADTWGASVVAALSNNYNIRRRYTLSNDSLTIRFESLQNDPAANLTVSYPPEYPEGSLMTFVVVQSAQGIQYTPNLRLYAEVWATIDGSERRIISATLPTDTQGRAQWDPSLVLTDVLRYRMNEFPSDDTQILPGALTYQVAYTEVYGDSNTSTGIRHSSAKRVVLGGLDKRRQQLEFVEFMNQSGATSFLLPNQRQRFRVLPDQPSWLTWINTTGLEILVHARITIYFASESFWIESKELGVMADGQKVLFPVGPDQLNVYGYYPEETAVRYSVRLFTESNRISPEVHFDIDRKAYPFKRYFMYQNSLGAFQTIATTGKKTQSYEVEKSTARIIPFHPSDQRRGDEVDLDHTMRNTTRVTSGYLSADELFGFRDFFLSELKYMYAHGDWIPINVDTSSIEELKEGNNLYTISFDVSAQHLETSWTGDH